MKDNKIIDEFVVKLVLYLSIDNIINANYIQRNLSEYNLIEYKNLSFLIQ